MILTVLLSILGAGVASSACCQQNSVSDYNLPDEVRRCMKAVDSNYSLSGKINPFYLRGDFFGDRKVSYAVLVRSDDQQGMMLCRNGMTRPVVLGAGTEFHKMKNLNFDAWQIHPRSRRVERGVGERAPPGLFCDAILLQWEESASALLYWDGRRFKWYQQGD